MNDKSRNGLSIAAAVVFAAGMAHAAIVFDVKTDRPDAVYKCGEKAVFTVTAKDDKGAPLQGAFTARLDNFGPKVIATAEVDLAESNVFTLEGTLSEPGFLRVHVDGVHQPVERRQLDYSVAFEPEKIVPAAPAPKDFLSFWLKAKDKLDAEVPLDPQVERVPAKCTDKYDYYKLSFATFGRRIYGLLTVPTDRRRAPYPVRVEVPGAGCGIWALKIKPAPDAICCFLAVNNFEPDEDDLKGAKEKWDAINAMYREKYATQEYSPAGLCESREEAYFYPVILGINRAVDWLARRDDINRNSFSYQGTSQGGGMGIILAALNRNFTHASFFVPALTDMLGYRAGRASGWPYPKERRLGGGIGKLAEIAPYFDAENFAPYVNCRVRVTVGFADTVCPPHSVYAAYNRLGTKDKEIWHGLGMGHGVRGEFYNRANGWIYAEQHKKFPVAEVTSVQTNGVTLATVTIRTSSVSKVKTLVALPPKEKWDGRLWFYGNGGAAGGVNAEGVLRQAAMGRVGVHTDMGTGNPSETLHRETIVDFGYRATHLSLIEAKRLAKEKYGREPDRCYFEGQSTGGGQGIHEALRYPGDFDGIMSGVPANVRMPLHTYFWWLRREFRKDGKPAFSEAELRAVESAAKEVLGKDDPEWCRGRFLADTTWTQERADAVLKRACEVAPSLGAPDSLARLNRALKGPEIDGRLVHTGLPFGTYMTWLDGLQFVLRWYVGQHADLDEVDETVVRHWNADYAPYLDATSPDLDAFAKRGGKMIVFAGLEDPIVPCPPIVDWYKSVVNRLGSQNAADEFMRFYLLPGRAHGGGSGVVELKGRNEALIDWVEKGVAPAALDGILKSGGTHPVEPLKVVK